MSEHGTLPVHLQALGFHRNPFPQTPDADCYFRTDEIAQHSLEAFHCLRAGKGFVLMTGEVGTGKSTFLRSLMDELHHADCAVSFVFNTFLQGRDLLLALNRDFGLAPGSDFAQDIDLLNHYLIEQYAAGRCCVLVIDDAQNLNSESLELLRLLSNLETRQNKLLQIVLSGQPELLDLLEKKEIRQLTSRIVQHIQRWPFTREECERYVNFRISKAGNDGRIVLSKMANWALHWYSKGNPRKIHAIMDRCLYGIAPGLKQTIGLGLLTSGVREVGVNQKKTWRAPIWISACLALVLTASWFWSGPHGAVSSAASATPLNGISKELSQVALPEKSSASPQENSVPRSLACLRQFGLENLHSDLEHGLDAFKRRSIVRDLSTQGFALAFVPAGLRLPDSLDTATHRVCLSLGRAGTWVLWKSAMAPFDLHRGLVSDQVKWLQERLTDNKLYSDELDGVYGRRTIDALHQFQRWHGLATEDRVDAWQLFLLEHEFGKVTS